MSYEMKNIIESKDINLEIKNLITQVEEASYLEKHIYEMGFQEGKRQAYIEQEKNSIAKAQIAANILFEYIKEHSKDVSIRQLRAGINLDSGEPSALVWIKKDDNVSLQDIRKIARYIERCFWNMFKQSINIWTVNKDALDESLIERDFPSYRVINA